MDSAQKSYGMRRQSLHCSQARDPAQRIGTNVPRWSARSMVWSPAGSKTRERHSGKPAARRRAAARGRAGRRGDDAAGCTHRWCIQWGAHTLGIELVLLAHQRTCREVTTTLGSLADASTRFTSAGTAPYARGVQRRLPAALQPHREPCSAGT